MIKLDTTQPDPTQAGAASPEAEVEFSITQEEARIIRNLGAKFEQMMQLREDLDPSSKAFKIPDQELWQSFNTYLIELLPYLPEPTQAGAVGGGKPSGGKALNQYTRNLTQEARQGKIDPIIGRDQELRRVLEILSRKTKNNPVLLGEAGVGKSAIAEALALRMADGDVPIYLQGAELRALDLSSLMAGAGVQGAVEERLKELLKELKESDGKVVLFIDELHTIIGKGGQAGTGDIANLLKPILARGEIRCVGATTSDEYRKYIEKDPALERRFQPVRVDEPSSEDAKTILRGIKNSLEDFHKVEIDDEAVQAAVELSERYIKNRYLPDKAIDLLDEAASRLRLAAASTPQEIDELKRLKERLEIEELSLAGDDDPETLGLKAEIHQKISELQNKLAELEAVWRPRQERHQAALAAEIKVEASRLEAIRARGQGDLPRAIKLEGQHLEHRQRLSELKGASEVVAEDIKKVVSQWSGVPLEKMDEKQKSKLLELESTLHQRVIGQDKAIEAVARAIRRSSAGLKEPNRPIGSFMFLGPTGVGKTELAKALAESMFGDQDAMVRIDMSEYRESHAGSRLIGSPPGYVGYDEGGQLTEALRKNPYSVVLLDEFEKAHPDISTLLLQVLDDGRLTDGQGRTVDCSNAVFIMTSNIPGGVEGAKKVLRPEFYNRIDEVVEFEHLKKEELRDIVDIQLRSVEKRLKDQDIDIEVTDEAKDLLVERGYDPAYGARPLKRTIQRDLVDELATEILEDEVQAGDRVEVGVADGKFQFTEENPA